MTDEFGIVVHRFGPHVFHTNCRAILDYLSRFTAWKSYRHRVQASLCTGLVPVPVNFNTIEALFKPARAASLIRTLVSGYGAGSEVPILKLRQDSDRVVRRFADRVYDEVFLGYTLKQWGMKPEELDESVTARVPVRLSRNDSYFTDEFEALPADGYTAMVERILSHPNIDVAYGVDYHEPRGLPRGRKLVYTGPIDRYFGYQHGALPYRSLRFEFIHHPGGMVQQSGTVTYPLHPSCTRSCEYRHLTGQEASGSTVSFEFPEAHRPGETVPFYPVPIPESRRRYRLYEKDAAMEKGVVFCGRLGRYQYLNMDQAVGQALKTAQRIGDAA
jgi:UDP-galactopyranose mutase